MNNEGVGGRLAVLEYLTLVKEDRLDGYAPDMLLHSCICDGADVCENNARFGLHSLKQLGNASRVNSIQREMRYFPFLANLNIISYMCFFRTE